jgi:hypothetical protein
MTKRRRVAAGPLTVFTPGRAEPVHDTSYAIRRNASDEEYYEILIPAAILNEGPR